MKVSPHPVYQVLKQLDSAKIHYTLTHARDDTIMVAAHIPGRHYEIEVFADGHVEVEIYKSDGQIFGEEALNSLLIDFSN